ncbi:MAG: type 4a pilus biogenesis protein PilO, partial [Acidimicrobiia bacterium]|nr:type 4a pilus biogenesis protein PilO [Acidimicrobiia bacterium]
MTRRVILGGVAAAVVLVVAWFLLLWSPQAQKVSDAEDRRATAEQGNQELELRLARLQALEERRPGLEAEDDALDSAVPGDPLLGELLLDLDEAANSSGVSVTSITPSEPTVDASTETAGGPTGIPVAIEVKGGYFEVLDYVNRLEDLPRVVVLDGLSLNAAETDAGETELSASLT